MSAVTGLTESSPRTLTVGNFLVISRSMAADLYLPASYRAFVAESLQTTKAMIKPQPSLMEVTRTLSNCASAAQFDFGEDTAIVAVQHMLWQTIDLFEAAAALGAKR